MPRVGETIEHVINKKTSQNICKLVNLLPMENLNLSYENLKLQSWSAAKQTDYPTYTVCYFNILSETIPQQQPYLLCKEFLDV
jgi:hypothetical protein